MTKIKKTPTHYELRQLAANAIAKSEPSDWRHHGVGMLQMYLAPDLRVHIWSPDLLIDGMLDSGAMHDHRFTLRSHVLYGTMFHTELRLRRPSEFFQRKATHQVFTVQNASTGKTDDPVLRDPRCWAIRRVQHTVFEGQSYTFPKWQFHLSKVTRLCVTLARKLDQENDRLAHLLAPLGTKPVHAFNHELLPEERIRALCEAAMDALGTR